MSTTNSGTDKQVQSYKLVDTPQMYEFHWVGDDQYCLRNYNYGNYVRANKDYWLVDT